MRVAPPAFAIFTPPHPTSHIATALSSPRVAGAARGGEEARRLAELRA